MRKFRSGYCSIIVMHPLGAQAVLTGYEKENSGRRDSFSGGGTDAANLPRPERARTIHLVPHRHVHFRISDVYVPEPAELLAHLHGSDLLQGRILDLSDGGDHAQAFAVVEVDGICQPLVVPVSKIIEFNS